MNNLSGAYLSEIILYTFKEDDNSKVKRNKFEEFLTNKNFIKEGDQSTMIRRSGYVPLKPQQFIDDLNKLCTKVEFSEGDIVTLITPTLLRKKTIISQNLVRPFLRRYKFEFNNEAGVFKNIIENRDAILFIEGIWKKKD